MRLINILFKLVIFSIFTGLSMVIFIYFYAYFSKPINLNNYHNYQLYDNNDMPVFDNGDNTFIQIDNINSNLINAIISVEDKNFYHHHGFDYLRIIKTFYYNLVNHKIMGGASTISQQLVKNKYLDFEKTYRRKIKEAFLTINLETHYNKDEILTSYLNTINFGGGAYGIESAALYYFNKNARDLTLEEALILAGIPKNPTKYNPLNNYDEAVKRAKIIATLMLNNDYINKDEYNNLDFNKIIFTNKDEKIAKSGINYYFDAVYHELNNIDTIPKTMLDNNLKIYTTLDLDSQNKMEESINKYMSDSKMQVASILVNPNNGEVLALVGGKNYYESQYNRVLSAKRQVGSTIKPLLYYCALNNGMVSSSTFLSEYTNFTFANNKSYSPKNFNDKYANKEEANYINFNIFSDFKNRKRI